MAQSHIAGRTAAAIAAAGRGRGTSAAAAADDEGDGDIGLQGLGLEESSPKQSSHSFMTAESKTSLFGRGGNGGSPGMSASFARLANASVMGPSEPQSNDRRPSVMSSGSSDRGSTSGAASLPRNGSVDPARTSMSSFRSESSSHYHSADEGSSSPKDLKSSPVTTSTAFPTSSNSQLASISPSTPRHSHFSHSTADDDALATPRYSSNPVFPNSGSAITPVQVRAPAPLIDLENSSSSAASTSSSSRGTKLNQSGASSSSGGASQSTSSTSTPKLVDQKMLRDVNSSKEARRLDRRLSRMRTDIAGPPAERPLAGSENGPTLAPRKASAGKKGAATVGSDTSTGPSDASLLDPANVTRPDDRTRQQQHTYSPTSPTSTEASFSRPPSTVPSEGRQERKGSLSAGMPFASLMSPSSSSGHSARGVPSNSSLTLQAAKSGPLERSVSPGTFSSMAQASLNEPSLQRWVLSVGCVNFDLEKGPDLEFLYPSLGISREERDNIAFSSFPDTSIFDDGHAVFSWRVREVPLDSSGSEAPVIATPMPKSAPASEDSWPRKTGHSGLRSVLSGLESAISRNHSGDEKLASPPPGSPTSRSVSPHQTSHFPDRLRPAGPRRQDSTASTPSLMSDDQHSSDAHALVVPQSAPIEIAPVPVRLARPGGSTSSNYIHGFCYFRQRRDATIRRGYFQKSVVILSHLPYVSFFSEIVRRIGPLYFEKGMPILEAFFNGVQNWAPPEPGALLHLPLLGSVMSVELPDRSQAQASPVSDPQGSISKVTSANGKAQVQKSAGKTDGSREAAPLLASVPCTSLFDTFIDSLDQMWLLWECLLLAEPILVVGPDPTTCSEAVWHMLDLIKPIPFAGDFRPFFTIHDYDFKTLVTKNKPSAGTILGVTNPFMLQACKHWPHILKVGRGTPKRGSHPKRQSSAAGSGDQGVSSGGASTAVVGGGIAGGNSAGGGGPEHSPGFFSKRKRRISKDRTLLKKLHEVADGKCSDEGANEMLRKYFADLTERFLAPLNRYVSSLIPADFDLSSPRETPRIKPFNTTAFLASLKAHGTPLPLRSRNLPTGTTVRQGLYLDFVQCPNFGTWLQSRIHESQEEQYMRKLAALETGNITSFATTRGELETMDLYTRLHAEIDGINERLLSGRREQELEPNSRWKPRGAAASKTPALTVTTGIPPSHSDDLSQQSILTPEASPQMGIGGGGAANSGAFPAVSYNAPSSSPPLMSLIFLLPKAASAASIRRVMGEPGWTRSFTQGERTLLMKKAGLIDQVERLMSTLPEDLRRSLQLKEQRRRSETLPQLRR